ncbi:Uncharacterised protein [Kluyvera cryocrescens]|uniref:Uncharacterized protein n=1 Tax=Kluyvera cryocrescens TaxID=580 RepID=A0A485A9L4_KLUCR|nr:Uncharacterised protein [Kluyvera cryocrescens]
MKRYLTALFFCAVSLTSQLAYADMIDDAIGNIQQAINDAYNPSSDRSDSNRDDDDRRWDDRGSRSQSSQQYNDRRRSLTIDAVNSTIASANWIRNGANCPTMNGG